jgi:hypothetical protein
MNERLFSFRWDIDHRACITDGIPHILEVCREFSVANTFFVNMGRSTNLKKWIGKGFARSKAKLHDKEAVHLIQKMGWSRFILETFLSRPVGLSFVNDLKMVAAEGHELGLHGGMDHVVWSRRFTELPDEIFEADIVESFQHFMHYFGRPAGFTSPGFQINDRVRKVLDQIGFQYNGDQIGGSPTRGTIDGSPAKHWIIPVTLAGPRTIPFLEWHGALNTPEAEVLMTIDSHLVDNKLVVLYGHPCFEGTRPGLLRQVFSRVLEANFRFVTHEEIANLLEAGKLETATEYNDQSS